MTYPTVITPVILEKNAHIPDESIRRDIAETEKDIAFIEGELVDAKAFVAFMKLLLEARGAKETND